MSNGENGHSQADALVPVYHYPDGHTGVALAGVKALAIHGRNRPFQFDTTKGEPKLPLRGFGEMWHTGWDIPTLWAVDGSGRSWMNNAHGHPLQRVQAIALVSNAETDGEKRAIRKALGLAQELTAEQQTWNAAIEEARKAMRANDSAIAYASVSHDSTMRTLDAILDGLKKKLP